MARREKNKHSILPANRQLQTLKGTGVSRVDCAAYDTRGREEAGKDELAAPSEKKRDPRSIKWIRNCGVQQQVERL